MKAFVAGSLRWLQRSRPVRCSATFQVCRTHDFVSATSTFLDIPDVCLTGEDRSRLARRYTQNAEAYQAYYLKGRYHWNKRTLQGHQQALVRSRRPSRRTPSTLWAYMGIADAYRLLGIWYLAPHETFPKARAAAQKALEGDDALAEAHTSMAWIKLQYHWEWPGSSISSSLPPRILCSPIRGFRR